MIKPGKPRKAAGRDALVGTWKLVSADNFIDGKWKPYSFGNPPSGYFIYDSNGHVSVQIMFTPPVKLAKADAPTPAEALAIFNRYIAYYGTWSVEGNILHQQVEGGLDPSQVGTDQPRPFELKDADTLIIGDQVTYRRTLKRVG